MADSETRQMLPDVQKYVEAIDAAEAARSKARADADEKYSGRYGYGNEAQEQRAAHRKAVNDAYKPWAAAFEGAWEALKSSSDPLVKWIAENCKGYESEARRVLEALPATLVELDELALDHDWCNTWARFRDQALEAGVLPGGESSTPARKALDRWFVDRYDPSSHGRREFRKLLDALVAEATAKTPEAVSA